MRLRVTFRCIHIIGATLPSYTDFSSEGSLSHIRFCGLVFLLYEYDLAFHDMLTVSFVHYASRSVVLHKAHPRVLMFPWPIYLCSLPDDGLAYVLMKSK
jgi:hypothetical protein